MDIKLPDTEVWIAGKGPSLDNFDWSKAGTTRIGINETALLIPDCWGAFALDYPVIDRLLLEMSPKTIFFRKNTHKRYIFPNMQIWNKPQHVQIICGTINIAIQVSHSLGATKYHFVGCDSIDTRKSNWSQKIIDIKGQGINSDGYARVNKVTLQLIKDLNLDAVWEHRNI